MTKQEIEEQYPKIAKLVWAIQTPNPETIGIYTSKIEREEILKAEPMDTLLGKSRLFASCGYLQQTEKNGSSRKRRIKANHPRRNDTRSQSKNKTILYYACFSVLWGL